MFRKTLYLQLSSSEPPDNSLLRALLLLSVPPFNAGIPESASRITRFVLAAVITDSSAAIIRGWPLKFLVCFRVPMFRPGIFVSLDLPDQLYIFNAPDVCHYCFYVFLSPLLVMGRLPPRCRQVKNMAFVITIIPHLQWFLLLSLVFQPSISFRIMSS